MSCIEIQTPMMVFLLSILSGLVATGAWVLFTNVFQKTFLPWFRAQRYQGVMIEGEWYGAYAWEPCANELLAAEETSHLCQISLTQMATKITGFITELAGEDVGTRYEIEGVFRDLILTLTYRESNIGRIDRGTITLFLRENGQRFEGHTLCYSDSGNEIKSLPYVWARSTELLRRVGVSPPSAGVPGDR